ncbi:hypothetical protein [Salinigranum sp. GCM10025319]|uniref:hypothetical protein n=1 Tax=Salinigranum sp. GCM10025319 TaxID=3252687 RepID=UPI003616C92A
MSDDVDRRGNQGQSSFGFEGTHASNPVDRRRDPHEWGGRLWIRTTTITVEGMNCDHCEQTVEGPSVL